MKLSAAHRKYFFNREGVKKLKVANSKLDIVLARQSKSLHELRSDISPTTLVKIRHGGELRPKTVGRLAQLLGCDPADLVAQEEA